MMSRRYSTTSKGKDDKTPPVGNHHDGSGKTYMQHKITKLQKGFEFQRVSNILKDCFVFVNGLTDPPRNEIQRLVSIHGGHFDSYQTSRTTHFICDIFPNTKLRELRKPKRVRLYYVTVQWLVQSIRGNQKLPEANFLPRGLANQHGMNIMKFIPDDKTTGAPDTGSSLPITDLCNSSELLADNHGSSVSTSISALTSQNTQDPARDGLRRQLSEALREDWGEAGGIANATQQTDHGRDSDTLPHEETHVQNIIPAAPAVTASVSSNAQAESGALEPSTSFVRRYFETSRLHFIGSWKARLPGLLATIAKEEAEREAGSLGSEGPQCPRAKGTLNHKYTPRHVCVVCHHPSLSLIQDSYRLPPPRTPRLSLPLGSGW